MTVSRALRGVGHVSPATAARVHEIARKLKYRPNPMVQAFMSSVRRRSVERTGSIAWVLNSTQHKKIAAPLEKVEAGARAARSPWALLWKLSIYPTTPLLRPASSVF
ncbi:MAG: LacI family transcriptional regulator [Blastochloris sp.]|nr:LacI family transcriptional regulator [Blastochloris sp.]